jgi:hypothetical protein
LKVGGELVLRELGKADVDYDVRCAEKRRKLVRRNVAAHLDIELGGYFDVSRFAPSM